MKKYILIIYYYCLIKLVRQSRAGVQENLPRWLTKVPATGRSRRGTGSPASSPVRANSRLNRTTSPSAARMPSPCTKEAGQAVKATEQASHPHGRTIN